MRADLFTWSSLAPLWDGNDFGQVHDWLGDRWNWLIQTQPLGEEDPDARFLQGLAYAALAFHFTQNRNQEGALLLLDDALQVLPGFAPERHGLAVGPVLSSLEELRPLIAGLENEADCPLQPFVCNPLTYAGRFPCG